MNHITRIFNTDNLVLRDIFSNYLGRYLCNTLHKVPINENEKYLVYLFEISEVINKLLIKHFYQFLSLKDKINMAIQLLTVMLLLYNNNKLKKLTC